jgi:hypothetical protein
VDDQTQWSGWSETVGIGDVRVPCPIPECGYELTVLVERWAEGEPPHERIIEQVTITEPCPVHALATWTPVQREAFERAAVEALLLGPDPDAAPRRPGRGPPLGADAGRRAEGHHGGASPVPRGQGARAGSGRAGRWRTLARNVHSTARTCARRRRPPLPYAYSPAGARPAWPRAGQVPEPVPSRHPVLLASGRAGLASRGGAVARRARSMIATFPLPAGRC